MKFLTSLYAGMALLTAGYAQAAPLPSHCENDTVEIKQILLQLADDPSASLADRVANAAEMMIGRGADGYYSTDSVGTLRLNVDTFTPETFVNTVLALADASRMTGANWRNFESRLGNLSLRRGENGGFPSIMWYSSDWIVDNTYRGNIRELTESYEGSRSTTKSLDAITRNRDKVAPLSNPDIFDKVRMTEMGYRTHRLPYLPKSSISRKDVDADMQNGDILVLLQKGDGFDTYRMGIVKVDPDGKHFICFDPQKGEVVKESEPLKRYFNLVTKHFSGYRWLRLREN